MSHRLDRDHLVEQMRRYGKPRTAWLTGIELERHLLDPGGQPATYDAEGGVRWLLTQLQADGWKPKFEGDNLIALTQGLASVTLEPGGQFELSGNPFARLEDIAAETTAFTRRVAELLEGTPYRQLMMGLTPLADVHHIGWMPKGRYVIMREHMAQSGPLGHHMMKGTAATQASYDYSDEADAAAKVQLAIRVAPLVTAMFANSPLEQGRPTGFKSYRGFIWTRTDPARTGFPAAATAFSFGAWVDYLLDAPMMFTHVGGAWQAAHGRTFRAWMTEGDAEGRFPTEADWDLHQTSVFPEVRVKHLIEVRMADCVPGDDVIALAALFKGLLYGAATSPAALDLADRFTHHGTQNERFLLACKDGLAGDHAGRPFAAWAEELVDVARSGLEAFAPGEGRWLDGLAARVAAGETLADRVLSAGPDAWTRDGLRGLLNSDR